MPLKYLLVIRAVYFIHRLAVKQAFIWLIDICVYYMFKTWVLAHSPQNSAIILKIIKLN